MRGPLFRFDRFELDPDAGELRAGGERVRIQELPLQLLRALVESQGHVVTREELRTRLWPSDTFVEFDQSLNTAVRKLRQALGDSAETPRFVETVARKGYRFLVPAETEWPAEALAAGDAPAPLRMEIRRRRLILGWTIVAICFIGAAVKVAQLMAKPHRRPPRAVAVLPFVNLTGDGQQNYLADAVTDSLINDLAASRTLRVISRTSAMVYKGSTKSTKQIAGELGVDTIVEGSLSRRGGRLRLNVRLVDGATDSTIWSKELDRDAANFADAQTDLSTALASQLDAALRGRTATFVTCSGPGYDLFLRGRYALNEGHKRNLAEAGELFARAAAADPDCAPIYSGQAEVALFRNSGKPVDDMLAAKSAAERALALDPSLADAHSSVAMVRMYLDHDWAGAEQEFRTALSLQPQRAETHHRFGQFLAARGRFDEAIAAGRRAVVLDPLASIMRVDLGRIYFLARRFDEAIAIEREVLRDDPTIELAHTYIWASFVEQGKFDEAAADARASLAASPDGQALIPELDRAVAEYGAREALRHFTMMRAAFADRSGWVSSSYLAYTFAALRDREKTLHYLELAVHSHTRDVVFAAVEPDYDFIRNEPRFQAVLKTLNEQ